MFSVCLLITQRVHLHIKYVSLIIVQWWRALGPSSVSFALLQKAAQTLAQLHCSHTLTYQHRSVRQAHTHTPHILTQFNADIILTVHMLAGSSELRHPAGPPLVSLLCPLWGSDCASAGAEPNQTAHLKHSSYGQRFE